MKKESLDNDMDERSPERRDGPIREISAPGAPFFTGKNQELFSDPQLAKALDHIIEENRPPIVTDSCRPILQRMIAGIKARIAAWFRNHAPDRKPTAGSTDNTSEKTDNCTL